MIEHELPSTSGCADDTPVYPQLALKIKVKQLMKVEKDYSGYSTPPIEEPTYVDDPSGTIDVHYYPIPRGIFSRDDVDIDGSLETDDPKLKSFIRDDQTITKAKIMYNIPHLL